MNMIRDPLDEMLKTDVREHRDQYIDDQGFTLRVMDSLPIMPARRQLPRVMKMAIPFGMTLIGVFFVVLLAGGKNFFIDVTMDLATETITRNVMALVLIAVALFAMVMASLVNDK